MITRRKLETARAVFVKIAAVTVFVFISTPAAQAAAVAKATNASPKRCIQCRTETPVNIAGHIDEKEDARSSSRSPAAGDARGSYAVVVSEQTYAMPTWRKVVDSLRKKHDGAVIVYKDSVSSAVDALRRMFPRYVCFVARPEEAGRDFIVRVHRMTRTLDDDPYTDVLWGVITGYDVDDALRIATREQPLILTRGLSGTGSIDLDAFHDGIKYFESREGVRQVKRDGGAIQEENVPVDSTRGIVDALNNFKPHAFFTSGHATEKHWSIGYTYKDGCLICKEGRLYGKDIQGELSEINSPNSKVFVATGNCLIGRIPYRDCMALAMMHSCGVDQMFGYTAVSFYGSYTGWGVNMYFTGGRDRYTLAESFFCANQSVVHQLETRFPKKARVNLEFLNTSACERMKELHQITNNEAFVFLWERDGVALYGDPAWEVRYPPCIRAWDYSLTDAGGVYTLKITANRDGDWGRRPVMILLAERLQNIELLKGKELDPVVTDNFILLPLKGKFKQGEETTLVFKARPALVAVTSADASAIVVKETRAAGKDKMSPVFDRDDVARLVPERQRMDVFCALRDAGTNAIQLLDALETSCKEHRKAVSFLIANMPERDLATLSSAYLLENVELAFEAREKMPWGKDIPDELFFNCVLPYANLTEQRDNWRGDFYRRFAPLVKGCATPGEAAVKLNSNIWRMVDVQYHATKRPKPDQSPYESIKAKYASCTGLSILFVDACRALCIPARVAGVSHWVSRSGNHSWAEVWDGEWHFVGAAEPAALDVAWFAKVTAEADPTNPVYSIYAVSFKKTALSFPCVWDTEAKYISAENVTERYAKPQKATHEKNVTIQAFDKESGGRIGVDVVLRAQGKTCAKGRTRDEKNDTNDMLEFSLRSNKTFEIEITRDGRADLPGCSESSEAKPVTHTFTTTNGVQTFSTDQIEVRIDVG